jgi:hypothetical protein
MRKTMGWLSKMDYAISLQAVFWIGAGILTLVGVISLIMKPFKKLDDHESRITSLESKADERRAIDQYTTKALNAIVNYMIDDTGGKEILKDVRNDYQNSIINRL